MLTLYDEAESTSCSDAMMMVLQSLVTQAHPPKGRDDAGGVFDMGGGWDIKRFEISVDKCVVHLEHYEWDTEKTTQHKATFGAEMMNFEDI
jgi:hypothetical protein